jgi:small GTP-binding protein
MTLQISVCRQKSSGVRMTSEIDSLKEKLKNIDEENVTIVLFGQPGSGKSSLINAVCGRKAVETGEETDTTKDAVVVENGDVTFIDLPGYGTAGFPEEAFLEKFQPFQYDLFLCVFSDKLRAADTRLFRLLEAMKKPCIFVRNKLDLIYEEGKTLEESEASIRRDIEFQLGRNDFDLVFVSTRKDDCQGIGHLNDVILSKMDEARREKYILTAEAKTREQLEEKKKAAMGFVRRSSTYSAYNGLNPLMVLDVTVDLMILYQMYTSIRQAFGITPAMIRESKQLSLKDKKLILGGMSREGIRMILKNASRQLVARTFLKVVPVVGQATAAFIGYKLVSKTGRDYVNACYKLAQERLLKALDAKRQ